MENSIVKDRQKSVTDIKNLLEDYNIWAEKTFPKSTAKSSLSGLKREIIELESDMRKMKRITSSDSTDGSFENYLDFCGLEYADCLMYIFDSARRFGFSVDDLFEYFNIKLYTNRKRDWKINSDKSYSHVKPRKSRAYICSPITGVDKNICISNFYETETKLLSEGYEVINPLELQEIWDLKSYDEHEKKEWKEYMKDTIQYLMECDIIFVVGDHTKSKGCILELQIARGLGIEIKHI